MLASAVMDRAKIILNDDNVTYTDAELLSWLNDGRVQVVVDRPAAYTVREVAQLEAGPAQSLDADCIALIDITHNMGTSGTVRGKAITEMDLPRIDRWRPSWPAEYPNAVVQHFIRNPLTPREYFVFPPQPETGMGYIERIVSKVLAPVVSGADIVLSDQWVRPLVEFVCWMAHAKDADVSDAGKMERHKANYYALMGGQS